MRIGWLLHQCVEIISVVLTLVVFGHKSVGGLGYSGLWSLGPGTALICRSVDTALLGNVLTLSRLLANFLQLRRVPPITLIFNNRLDAVVTGVLIALVSLLLFESVRQWIELLSGKKAVQTAETPFVPTRLAGERA